MLLVADSWSDFTLIDAGDNEKIEKWGNYILRRPDPQAIWPRQDLSCWDKYDGYYERHHTGGGRWKVSNFPQTWTINYKDLKFLIKPTGFKHTGLFPEQAVNWDFMIEKIKNTSRKVSVLNLFAYTGGATVACCYAGAEVCHVDSAKGVVTWAKENIELSNLQNCNVRFIVDDVIKFVEREIRRGKTYDAIIMDPPVFGRGTQNEVWRIEEQLVNLINLTLKVWSNNPLFYIINSYTSAFSPIVLHNIMETTVNKKVPGLVQSGEIGLRTQKSNLILPCGIYSRWEK
ncbi:MAG TPA: class I SAM-dependent methyltransferase [Haloplasmataceae bacterium]